MVHHLGVECECLQWKGYVCSFTATATMALETGFLLSLILFSATLTITKSVTNELSEMYKSPTAAPVNRVHTD